MTKNSKLSGSGRFVKGGSGDPDRLFEADDRCEDCFEVGRCGACAIQDSFDEDLWEEREFIDFAVTVKRVR